MKKVHDFGFLFYSTIKTLSHVALVLMSQDYRIDKDSTVELLG